MVPFIAETGGLNAMIADSSALPEQVIRDVVRSAFNSAGQRCSAARLFFVQEDVAKPMVDMLVGAVQALDIGDPLDFATDIGPVIDEDAMDRLDAHKLRMQKQGAQLVDLPLPFECAGGHLRHPGCVRTRRCAEFSARKCSARSCTWCVFRAAISTRSSMRSMPAATA